MNRVLNLILTHQGAEAVAAMLAWWEKCVPRESILLAHGGRREDFEAIAHAEKVFVDDKRLRTRDHTRERQSYGAVMRAATQWLAGRDVEFVHFAEYDHVPLVPDLNARQLELLRRENADVLGFHVRRVDETNCAHALYHVGDPGARAFWKSISVRENPRVILSMIATGSFWTRTAFEAVAGVDEPTLIYVEIALPTLPHHLGFRVRDYGAQTKFVRAVGEAQEELETARQAGAWTLHPVKRLWDSAAAARV